MKIFKSIIFALLAVVLIALIYVGITVYKVSASEQEEPRNLNVIYSRENASTAIARVGVEVEDLSNLNLGTTFETEGTVAVASDFSDAEISAIQNYANEKNGPFKNVQIHFIGDDQVEGSGFVSHPQVNAPVYARGTVKQTGARSFSVDIERLEVSGVKIPSYIADIAGGRFSSYVNNILSKIEGLDIKKVEIKQSAVFFQGDVPSKIK